MRHRNLDGEERTTGADRRIFPLNRDPAGPLLGDEALQLPSGPVLAGRSDWRTVLLKAALPGYAQFTTSRHAVYHAQDPGLRREPRLPSCTVDDARQPQATAAAVNVIGTITDVVEDKAITEPIVHERRQGGQRGVRFPQLPRKSETTLDFCRSRRRTGVMGSRGSRPPVPELAGADDLLMREKREC